MSLYSDLISSIRSDVNDYPVRRFDSADGDGVTSVFALQNSKVLENSYTFQVGGVTQPENTAYVLDPNVGQVIFATGHLPPAANDNVTFQYESVNMRDADYVDLINQVLLSLRKKLWIEFINETDSSLISVLNLVDYPLSAIASDILQLNNIEYQTSPTAPWQDVRGFTNCIFYKDLQILHVRPPFSVSGYQMRIKGLRGYILGSSSSSTLELQQKFWPVVRKYVEALYWERMAAKATWQNGALAKEINFENMAQLKELATTVRKTADQLLSQVKLVKPPTSIPNVLFGVSI